MLKHRLSIVVFSVLILAGNTPKGAVGCLHAEEIQERTFFSKPGVPGTEKACDDHLPAMGVSFPTRFYADHAAAYSQKLVVVQAVQTVKLPELHVAGTMKSTTEYPCLLQDRAVAKADLPYVDLPYVEMGSEFEKTHQQVVFQEVVIPAIPAIPADMTEATKREQEKPPELNDRGLFTLLRDVNLEKAFQLEKNDNTLPPNDARIYFDKAGTQYNLPTGQWISFRPARDTFPFQHNPLYFEDPNLERCGRSAGCLTNAVSVVHFAGRIPILPYLMTTEPPRSLVRSKVDCPTGCKFGVDGYLPHPDEIDLGAAAVQAAFTVGFIFLIP